MRYEIRKFYSQYKGIWYRYIPLFIGSDGFGGIWELSDMQNGMGLFMQFNADTDRIDKCFECFNKELEQATKEGYVRPDSPGFKPKVFFTTIKDENGNVIDAWDSVKQFSK